MTVWVQRTDGRLDYTFDWSADVTGLITLQSVTHSVVPDDLLVASETTNSTALTSTVFMTGGRHAGKYLIKALALLSNGLQVPGEATIRVFDA